MNMSSIFEVLFEEVGRSILGWYVAQFDISTPFRAVVYILFNFLLVKGILTLFPFLNPLADFLTWPFRLINLYSHIDAARELDIEIKQNAKLNPPAIAPPDEEERRIEFGVYNRFELDKRAVGSNFYFSGTRVADTSKIALASTKIAVLFFLVYLAIFPFVAILGIFGFIIHLYSSLVLFHALFPSTNEQMMVLYELMRGGHIPPLCMYWVCFVFGAFSLETLLRSGGNIFLGLFSGIVWSHGYLFFLTMICQWFNVHSKQKYPVLRAIPDSSETKSENKHKSAMSHFSSELNYE